jgi:hypothetical protein
MLAAVLAAFVSILPLGAQGTAAPTATVPSWPVIWGNVAAIASAVLTAVAVIVAGISFRRAREQFFLTERADVLFTELHVNPPKTALTSGTTIKVTIKNFGRSRAAKLQFQISFVEFDDAPPASASGLTKRLAARRAGVGPVTRRSILGSASSLSLNIPALSDIFEASEIQAVNTGEAALRLFGRLSYEDIFGAQHIAHAHADYDARSKRFRVTHFDSA